MRCAKGLQALGHHSLREFGFVAVATKVAQVKMTQIGRHDFLNTIGGGFVGEMAVSTKDALLQAPWTMRTILQHLHVVIGFEHQGVRAADAIQHQLCDVTEVCGETDVATVGS